MTTSQNFTAALNLVTFYICSCVKMLTGRNALSVDDVFERLETVKTFVTARRQIDLSKRDVNFLLEYRHKMELSREDLAKRTNELDCIKQVLKTVSYNIGVRYGHGHGRLFVSCGDCSGLQLCLCTSVLW